jgi:hypothetical protein
MGGKHWLALWDDVGTEIFKSATIILKKEDRW